jgi:thiamine-monophosphate kinase
VDGVHFDRAWSTAYEIGRRAAAGNLADVAAMGAVPTALLVGFAAPGSLPLDWGLGLVDGLRDEAGGCGASVIGGDVTRSEQVTIAVSALGTLAGRPPVTRGGARPGDVIVVAGRLGWAAAGLAILRAGLGDEPEFASVVSAHRRPLVPYAAAVDLAVQGATAMIDVSDGLLSDLGHIAAASGVACELTAGALPIADELRAAGERLGVDPVTWVAAGGDDHAFVATLPRAQSHVIGRVLAGEPAVRWADGGPTGELGYEHFRSPG